MASRCPERFCLAVLWHFEDDPINLQALCFKCNANKGARCSLTDCSEILIVTRKCEGICRDDSVGRKFAED